ncbi:MAG: CRISPR-associated endonuclease Cas6 [Methanoregula sp.]|nr:CRISPR-associated endonuclease Cas6 [Methanoregula sp.]
MILHTFTLTLGSTRPILGSAQELRGFFATKFTEYTELHQHDADKFIYRYPVVQYKMIDNTPMVIGINEGAEVLKQIYDEYEEIRLGANTYQIVERGISLKDEEFGISEKIHSYEFVTPWLALNQENYRKFYTLKGKVERDEFVRKILIGNIISMSKSMGYDVPGQIKCDANVHFKKDRLKDVSVMTFTGKFYANFIIPDYLGIGKSVSRGFGAVRQLSFNKDRIM